MKNNFSLLFASGNLHKTIEIRAQIPHYIQLQCLTEIGYHEELTETGETLMDNAQQKVNFAFEKFGGNVFAEDTGLEVYALNNEPGIFSARYAGPQRNAQDNMDFLQKRLWEIQDINPDRSARFRTVIALIWEGKMYHFEGEVEGLIGHESRGLEGFGYDPIFVPIEGDGRTFAEMSTAEKLLISHRGRAVQKLIQFLSDL
jgi:XTP/dITP diphosphohydrolase